MEEIKCEQVGQIVGSGFTEMTGRIYSENGLSPSIRTFAGGNTEVKIAEPIIYDDYNGRIRADQDCIGTLTTNFGNDALRNGVKIIEPIAYDEQNGYLRQDGCVGTLTTDGSSPKHNYRVVEPNFEQDEWDMLGTIYELSKTYCIRKLIERECFRLMGVKESDFERVAKNQSMSALYHEAGDSIVTTCLMAIFGQLFGVDYQTKINELVGELRQ